MSGQDLFRRMEDLERSIHQARQDMRKYGLQCSQANYKFRRALCVEMLKHKADGMPVSILRAVCIGLPEVSDLKLAKDIAEVEYRSAIEAINAYKLDKKQLGEQIDREYRG